MRPLPCGPQDFYAKECWAHHPLPYADFVEHKREERQAWDAARRQQEELWAAPPLEG